MAVYKRGPAGIFHVEFEYRGQRVKRSARTTSKRQAEEFERKLRDDLRARYDLLGDRPSMTFGEAVDRYFDSVLLPKTQGRPTNAKTYLYILNRLRAFFGPDTPLENLKAADFADYRDQRLKAAKPGTVARELVPLRAIMNCAVNDWGVLASAPRVIAPKVHDERIRWLREDEEVRMMAAAPPWLADLLVFYLDTGARKAEALTLRWSEVDLDRKPRAVVRFLDTKNREPRSVPLTRRLAAVLARLQRKEGASSSGGRGLVFLRPSENGGGSPRVPVGDFKKTWGRVREKAELEDFHVHDLRHTYASRLVMKGAGLPHVAKLMGHKTIRMTMRYAHLAPEALDGAVALLDPEDSHEGNGDG